jgi:hypothetical protein
MTSYTRVTLYICAMMSVIIGRFLKYYNNSKRKHLLSWFIAIIRYEMHNDVSVLHWQEPITGNEFYDEFCEECREDPSNFGFIDIEDGTIEMRTR